MDVSQVLLSGVVFGESPRWHDGRLWFSDWGAREVADEVWFPNSLAVTPDNSTLVVAESYRNRPTAFDIDQRGDLSNRRVWADLGTDVPEGICLDAEGAIWYADGPNRYCVRVREGGPVLQTITADRGGFSCARRTRRPDAAHRGHPVERA